MENPLYDLFISASTTRNNRDRYDLSNYTQEYEARCKAVIDYSWAIPTQHAIDTLVSLSPIIEIGAGTGYWAWLVEQCGGEIMPTDLNPPHTFQNEYKHLKEWTRIEACDSVVAASTFPEYTLMMCWPNYNNDHAYQALMAYWNAGGRKVVYIGEGAGGCTGCHKLHRALGFGGECERHPYWWDERDEWPEEMVERVMDYSCSCNVKVIEAWTETVTLPCWQGVYDAMYVIDLVGKE